MIESQKPAGFYTSLLSAEAVAKGKDAIAFPLSVGDWLFWQESLAEQSNRTVLKRVSLRDGTSAEIFSPEEVSLGSRVHEYGGIAYGVRIVLGNLYVALVNKADQAVYLYQEGQGFQKIFQDSVYRFAQPVLSDQGVMLIAEKKVSGAKFPKNLLVLIDYSGNLCVLHQGEDFYGGLTLSPDQQNFAFISWSMNEMPWDHSKLWQASWNDVHHCTAEICVDQPDVAVFQPEYDPKGRLYYVADYDDLSQIYAASDHQAVASVPAEFSLPFWQIGMRTYTALGNNRFAATVSFAGAWCLGIIQNKQWQTLDDQQGSMYQPIPAGKGFVVLIAPNNRDEYLAYYSDLKASYTILAKASTRPAAPWVVTPSSVYFEGQWGKVQGYFYRPKDVERPPVIIKSHGGPSGQADPSFQRKFQFWLTRGFAIFDINYSGSTGFGRKYRQRLNGSWGTLDSQDCLDGLQYLIDQGWVDARHAFISGSSAGGLTTLNSLCHSKAFAGGVSYYGVCDLLSLVAITHKFEARYLDHLVGTLPEDQDVYEQRSPINHAHKITSPMLFLHGDQDPVVPLSQMQNMVKAIKDCGDQSAEVSVEILEGEGHGFRDPESIAHALECELAFYQKHIKY